MAPLELRKDKNIDPAKQEVLARHVLGGLLALRGDVGHPGVAGNAFLGRLDLLCRMAFCVWIDLANLSAREFAIADFASLNPLLWRGVAPHNASDMLPAIEHVIVIIRPCAGRAGLGGADQAEHFCPRLLLTSAAGLQSKPCTLRRCF
jgi:hypothetical protein